MIIRVKIYAYLRYYLPAPDRFTQDEEWDVPEKTTIAQVVKELNLSREISIIVLLNGRSADQETVLKEGDTVHILPQIAGGASVEHFGPTSPKTSPTCTSPNGTSS